MRKDYTWEIGRLCSQETCRVIWLLSFLLKIFVYIGYNFFK